MESYLVGARNKSVINYLFYDAGSGKFGLLVRNNLGKMRKEAVTYFEVISRNFLDGASECH
jgi:hypothetical protein